MFDKALFKATLTLKNKTMSDAAAILGCNEATLYRKYNGISDFTRDEIQKFKKAFNLTASDIDLIFFAEKLA